MGCIHCIPLLINDFVSYQTVFLTVEKCFTWRDRQALIQNWTELRHPHFYIRVYSNFSRIGQSKMKRTKLMAEMWVLSYSLIIAAFYSRKFLHPFCVLMGSCIFFLFSMPNTLENVKHDLNMNVLRIFTPQLQ